MRARVLIIGPPSDFLTLGSPFRRAPGGAYTPSMERDRFRRLVQRALRGIPPEFTPYLDNIAIVIQREPGPEDREAGHVHDDSDLFGLYVGVPRTERLGGDPVLPDRIVIFQGPIERHFHPADIPLEVARTVIHEVAHHFGIDDDRLHTLGAD